MLRLGTARKDTDSGGLSWWHVRAWMFGLLALVPLALLVRWSVLAARQRQAELADARADNPATHRVMLGKSLANVSLATADGHRVRLGDYRGRFLLVDFWATWCPGCVHDWPDLQRWIPRIRPAGLDVLPVSIDEEGAPKVNAFLRTHPAVTPVALDPKMALANRFGDIELEFGVLLDPQSRVIDTFDGVDRQEVLSRLWRRLVPAPALIHRQSAGSEPTLARAPHLDAPVDLRLDRPSSHWQTVGASVRWTPAGAVVTATAPFGYFLIRDAARAPSFTLDATTVLLRGKDLGAGVGLDPTESRGTWMALNLQAGLLGPQDLQPAAEQRWLRIGTLPGPHRWRLYAWPGNLNIGVDRSTFAIGPADLSPGLPGFVLVGRGTTALISRARLGLPAGVGH